MSEGALLWLALNMLFRGEVSMPPEYLSIACSLDDHDKYRGHCVLRTSSLNLLMRHIEVICVNVIYEDQSF